MLPCIAPGWTVRYHERSIQPIERAGYDSSHIRVERHSVVKFPRYSASSAAAGFVVRSDG